MIKCRERLLLCLWACRRFYSRVRIILDDGSRFHWFPPFFLVLFIPHLHNSISMPPTAFLKTPPPPPPSFHPFITLFFYFTCRILFVTTCRCTAGSTKCRMRARARAAGGLSISTLNPVEPVDETGHNPSTTATPPHQRPRERRKRGKSRG